MVIGIDATNIRGGGGLTHLLEVITNSRPAKHNVTKVIIWGGKQLENFPSVSWLELRKIPALDGSFYTRVSWILFHAKKEFAANCDILWSPGGVFYSLDIPYVSMSQNMLVFEKRERDRFPVSFEMLRLLLLNFFQRRSFSHARGVIFLTRYASDYIRKRVVMQKSTYTTVISHGVSTRFKHIPKVQAPISDYTMSKPFKILYVSIVIFYKHHVNLMNAVKELRKQYPVELVLIGPMYEPCAKQFYHAIRGHEEYIIYKGEMEYDSLNEAYHSADLFAFCSTCENMPNILIEAMSSGLPILSSSYGPMPEILQDGGLYCDPLQVVDIVNALKKLIEHPDLRTQLAKKSYAMSEMFSWRQCADQTFSFINFCYNGK